MKVHINHGKFLLGFGPIAGGEQDDEDILFHFSFEVQGPAYFLPDEIPEGRSRTSLHLNDCSLTGNKAPARVSLHPDIGISPGDCFAGIPGFTLRFNDFVTHRNRQIFIECGFLHCPAAQMPHHVTGRRGSGSIVILSGLFSLLDG
jgi:hypothetical protein